jgi:ketosteroid isomerase-like protein
MSQENVDRFLEASDALNRGDQEGWLRIWDAKVVFEPRVSAIEGGFTGHDGLRRFIAELFEQFETYRVEYDDVRDVGDLVVALGTARGRGKESGAEAEEQLGLVATFRDGKIVHFKDYGDREQALQAAGLSG